MFPRVRSHVLNISKSQLSFPVALSYDKGMRSTFQSDISALNKTILSFNPLLGVFQNTPRGGVFLSDESGALAGLSKFELSNFERAYLYKRQAKLGEAIKLFEVEKTDNANIQLAFIYRALKKHQELINIAKEIKEKTWSLFFLAEAKLMSDNFAEAKGLLRSSLEANRENVHALAALINCETEPLVSSSLKTYVDSCKSPAIWANFSLSMYRLGNLELALPYAVKALNSGLLQTNLFISTIEILKQLSQLNELDHLHNVAESLGISELRAAIGLVGINDGSASIASKFYSKDSVKVFKDPFISNIQKEAFSNFRGDMIHDGDASSFDGRYFSLDITNDENFTSYFKYLKQKYNEIYQSKDLKENYDFTWSDISMTTNSSRIANHLHTAGVDREYLYTFVSYPKVPSQISKDSNEGYLRIGPPRIAGFKFDTWQIEVMPQEDLIVCFPSSFFHETIALPLQDSERVSINTDFGRYTKTPNYLNL